MEILGYRLGGAGDIPSEIFEGDDVLGIIFDKIFNDRSSTLYQPSPGDDGYEHLASPDREVSDGEAVLDLFVNCARKIREARNQESVRAG